MSETLWVVDEAKLDLGIHITLRQNWARKCEECKAAPVALIAVRNGKTPGEIELLLCQPARHTKKDFIKWLKIALASLEADNVR